MAELDFIKRFIRDNFEEFSEFVRPNEDSEQNPAMWERRYRGRKRRKILWVQYSD